MADSRNHHDRGSSVRSLDAETVLDRHARDIARWCLHILRDPHDAEDCAQEAMVRIYEHAATFRGEAPVSAWVYEVTRTTCLKWLRSQRRRREATSALETPTEPATAPSPFESLADRETRELFHAMFERNLDRDEALALRLHHVDGWTVSRVTDSLGLSNRAGARAVLARAKRKLRGRLPITWIRRLGYSIPANAVPATSVPASAVPATTEPGGA